MRLLVQRVKSADVSVSGKTVAAIGKGMLVLVGISKADTSSDVEKLAIKLKGLRIFEDELGKMN